MQRSLLLSLVFLTSIISCSKKEDSQPQDSSLPYSRINTQFDGDQGLAWLRGYLPENCIGSVLSDPTGSNQYLYLSFVAEDKTGEKSETIIAINRSRLLPGIVGTYSLQTDFDLKLNYRPTANSCTNTAFAAGQPNPRNFTITSYNSSSKSIAGTFDVKILNQANPQQCPITSSTQRGSVEVSGEFKNIVIPF